MSNYDSYQRKRAQDNLKLAQLQKEIADQEATIANARGFGARRKIKQAENNLAKLKPQVNTLIAQMQLEDAKIEAELLEQEERARKALEQEKQRQLAKIKAEEQRKLAEERKKKQDEDKARRAKEQEERERLKAEKWASLTPDEQQAEINKRRKNRILFLGGIVALIFMCFCCVVVWQIGAPSQSISSANTPTSSPITTASEESAPIPTLVPTQIPTSTPEPTAIPTLVPTQIPTPTPEPTATFTLIPPPTETPTPSPEELFNYTILRQWRPNQNPNSFSAEVLLEDDLSEEELVSFVKYFDRDFELVNILVFTSMEAYDEFKSNTFDDEVKRGYLVYYIRNDSSGTNEIRWMQQIGKFDHLYGETTKFSSP